ncbi:hypothetical protein B0H17DRAFT_1135960 [Mycena rosella]|uniref:DUF6589 domain-containing protein n=1 Tax=Mycena rosella TaxID=1033263 RepID=A0AAD7DBR9_MYCRO|nr:hypothetical protein B0H17DRAFT_1135960 [Mycena rosella]
MATEFMYLLLLCCTDGHLEENADAADVDVDVETGEEVPEEILSDPEEAGKKKRKKKKKKIWILCFSGSFNRNYANYLLETYCLHRYESSEDYSNALLNNWLVNLSGKKWTECDFAQEGFNKCLEEMVEHKGGDIEGHFYRHTLAPNVFHFLRIKEQIEEAFELKHRGKTHGTLTSGTNFSNYSACTSQHNTEPAPPATDEAELERLIQYAIDHLELFPEDNHPEEEEGDNPQDDAENKTFNEGDIGARGLEYSDDEELDDGPKGQHSRAMEEFEGESEDEDKENESEQEEQLDRDILSETV